MLRFTFPLTAALLAASTFGASALPVTENYSYTGTFAQDNSVVLIDFTVDAPTTVTLRSYSYDGGEMADGTVVAAGGFDPILSLFDSAGALIDYNDDSAVDDTWDVLLQVSLSAGDYTVAISQYNNQVIDGDLANGWVFDEQPWFTATNYPCSASMFCDFNGDSRTSAWAFDVLNVTVATVVDDGNGGGSASAVPLPAAAPLMGAALGLLGFAARRRRG
ncbi:DVUA0089 family protein [Albimonas pacifica]|uniref:VPLPA-CTERM protein sorting domain-containing protein n=1 Tax=Albimonas pacifica TaxID=1114924 RepID=A0A1I3JZS2_9RHOB|nr:DVUA0089 family protein [Albimonas pacifica]SFI65789.1 VPLPA-CTERM protein sorting domain-containing protein [Albimonas pacifica]